MTRYVDQGSTEQTASASVEIPEAVVEQACEVMHDAYERAAVVHAWETNPASRHQDWADVPETNKATMRDAVRALLGWLGALETTPQPAGDSGLREALEKALATLPTMAFDNGYPVQALPKSQLLSLLALYPAAPAVPQPASEATPELTSRPVDREALEHAIGTATGHVCEMDQHEEGGWEAGCTACAGWGYPCAPLSAAVDAVLAVLAGEQEQVRE